MEENGRNHRDHRSRGPGHREGCGHGSQHGSHHDEGCSREGVHACRSPRAGRRCEEHHGL